MTFCSPTLLGLAAAIVLAAGYALYQATIPKPIPGIPYTKATAKKPFGDLPDFIRFNKRTKEVMQFVTNRAEELNTPVCQLFVKPFRKPWVVIADAREAQDIMARRWREFDRGGQFGDMFGALVPHGMVIQPTDEKWRSQRRLAGDTMSPQFLHNVVAPIEERVTKELLAVWQVKTSLAEGHAFSAYDDIDAALLDNIIAICFGSTAGAMDGVMKPLSGLKTLDNLSVNEDDLAVFPAPARNEIQYAMATVIHSANIGASSPLGILHHQFAVKWYPELRRCVKIKNDLMTEKLVEAWKKFNRPSASEDDIKSATDLFVAREVSQAAKQKRTPVYDSPEVRDELFTFLLAGWETTATALKWMVKHLTAQQEIQHRLREDLRAFYKDAAARGEMPSHKELVQSQPAYLNAVLEEILRHSTVAAAGIRTTTQDVEVLGYHIPKGTDIWMPNRGKGMLAPSFPVEEPKRSKTSQFVKPEERWTAEWDDNTLDRFMPERWLRLNKQGGMEFDAQSGPMQTFGAGLRGCFGRKLAMMSLRMLLTYVVWSFELLPVPEEFSGFEAEDRLTWEPQQVHLRLKRCEYQGSTA